MTNATPKIYGPSNIFRSIILANHRRDIARALNDKTLTAYRLTRLIRAIHSSTARQLSEIQGN